MIPVHMGRPAMTCEADGLFPVLPALRADAAGVEGVLDAIAGRAALPNVGGIGNPCPLRTKDSDLSHTRIVGCDRCNAACLPILGRGAGAGFLGDLVRCPKFVQAHVAHSNSVWWEQSLDGLVLGGRRRLAVAAIRWGVFWLMPLSWFSAEQTGRFRISRHGWRSVRRAPAGGRR